MAFRTPILLALLVSLAACAAPPPVSDARAPIRVASLEPTRSPFRAALDGRWSDHGVPDEGRAILVNLPSFELIAFEDGEPALRSRVIVGSRRTPTPEMTTHVSAVRFRPTWRPTPGMIASGEYEDRIRPAGPRNPLGLAAIRLEPGLLIYLHDTNRPALFEKEMRALSHGCVRTERWDALAAWLLGIDVEEVLAHANGARTFDMPTEPVPVLIRYYTEFPDEGGALRAYPDIYGKGAARIATAPHLRPIA